jgi:lipopolysaccharide/colanic/teichoic acid biosynthesis glycosyltransferase
MVKDECEFMPQTGWRLVVKQGLDRTVAVFVLIATSPATVAIAWAIRRSIGRPVFFRQVRPGRHGAPFTIVKFRTMRDAHDHEGVPLPDAERLTRLGRFLRSTSLDELPQLWNVLRGDLSLVGPRPLMMEYLDRYSPEQARRHDVLPGITGWAQINGRNAIDWDEKLALDVWYVDHWSLSLDARILAKTVWAVASRRGVSFTGHATMPAFMGNSPTEPCRAAGEDDDEAAPSAR